jgi:hypothetical protein
MRFEKKLALAGDWALISRKAVELTHPHYPVIFNLEAPVMSDAIDTLGAKSRKAGPSIANFQLPPIQQPAVVALANNHTMDFGERGLSHTVGEITKRRWLYAGAGDNKNAARNSVTLDWCGKKAATISRCETQFGVATETKAGVAALDSTIYEQIRLLKKEVDIVIVSIHAAAEMVPWPSPQRQDTWRSLIDVGADVIHGHHAHVPQGWEEYNGGLIFYGLGNFCVDPDKWSWHPQGLWSLTPELSIEEKRITMQLKTSVIEDRGESILVREASEAEQGAHLIYLDQCNQPLSDRVLLEGLWQEASVRMYEDYFSKWLRFDSTSILKETFRQARKKAGEIKRRFRGEVASNSNPSRADLLLWYHLFACESHNDAISTALGVLAGELEDLRSDKTTRLVNELMVLR